MARDEGRPGAGAVRGARCGEDREEGEEVGGRGETLGFESCVAHLPEDRGEEDGQRGVGHVG